MWTMQCHRHLRTPPIDRIGVPYLPPKACTRDTLALRAERAGRPARRFTCTTTHPTTPKPHRWRCRSLTFAAVTDLRPIRRSGLRCAHQFKEVPDVDVDSGLWPSLAGHRRLWVYLESGRRMHSETSTLELQEAKMRYAILRKFLAVLFGLVLTATGLWASPAGEEEPAAAMEKGMVDRPHHRQGGDRAGVRRDVDRFVCLDRRNHRPVYYWRLCELPHRRCQ